jgi:uncharacterized membrane protein YfcA
MWLFVGLLGFGLVVGVLSGLLGIGGGILLVPGLVVLFGIGQTEAQGTSLAVLALPVLGFAAMVYYQAGYIRMPVAGIIALGFVVGAYGGARLVPYVNIAMLRFVFGVLLLYVGILFVTDQRRVSTRAALPTGVAAIATAMAAYTFRRWSNRFTAANDSASPKSPEEGPADKDSLPAEYHI